jgi:RND superfamily putative drug exporter
VFRTLGKLVCRFPWTIVLVALALVALSGFYGRDVMQHLTLAPGWEVPGSGSERAATLLNTKLGVNETAVIVLLRARDGSAADAPAFRAAAETILARLSTNPDVRSVTSYYTSAEKSLVSSDGRMTYAVVHLVRGRDEGIAAFGRLREQARDATLEVRLGGELATYAETRTLLENDLRRAELASFVLLAVLLVWVFGSLAAATLPLIVAGVTMVLSIAMLKLASQFIEISLYSANVVSMLGLGLSIDYGLFILSRFREEQARSGSATDVMCATLITSGRTVAYSGVTVAASLFCLHIMPQRFFQNMGLAGGISVVAAMLTSVLLLPALLALLGTRVNRFAVPGFSRRAARSEEGGRWYRFSHFVMRHAGLVLAGSIALLFLVSTPIGHMRMVPADHTALPKSAESRAVIESLRDDFPSAGLEPLIIAIETRAAMTAPASIAALHALTERIRAVPGVTRIGSLTSLETNFSAADYQMMYQYPEQFPIAAETLKVLVRDRHTRVYVFYDAAPQSAQAMRLVREIRALPASPDLAAVHVGGYPAFQIDYIESLTSQSLLVVAAIVCVIFVLLFLMLGSLLVPAKVVLTNLLSLSATFGVLVWIFQDGHLAGLLNFSPPTGMDGTVLVLVFASAFGLSIDYEVFLLSRVKEMCDATGDTLHAVATGIQRSGPIITNAALLIGVVLGAFAFGDVVFMKEIGLGLLIAVMIDATLVRMLLVPASLRLLGRLNWWAPKPLMMIYDKLNMGETGHAHQAHPTEKQS